MSKNIVIIVNRVRHLVNVDSIVYINAEGAYCNIMLEDSTFYTVACNMKTMMLKIARNDFLLKIHRSWVINTNHVNKLDFLNSVTKKLILQGRFEIPLGRKEKQVLKEMFKKELGITPPPAVGIKVQKKTVPKKNVPNTKGQLEHILKDLKNLPIKERLLVIEKVIESFLHTNYEQELMNIIGITIKGESTSTKVENAQIKGN